MSDKIREAFDVWRSSNGWQRPDDPGEWEAWQAALAQRPASAAVPDGYVLVTPEQLEKHTTTAWEFPPQSLVVLVSSLKLLHAKNAAAPAPAAQDPIVLRDDVRELLQEWIDDAVEDDDHDLSDQLTVLLGPIYTAQPATEQPLMQMSSL